MAAGIQKEIACSDIVKLQFGKKKKKKKLHCFRRHRPLVSPCCFAMTAKMTESKIFNFFMRTFKRRNVSFFWVF